MQPHRFGILVVAAMVAACAEPPFIEARSPDVIAKPDDQMRLTGQFVVCYAGQDYPMAEQIARQRCASFGFQTMPLLVSRYQCRVSAPHQARFQCYQPDMTDEKGVYINPFDVDAVEEWRQRTGKTSPVPPTPGWSAGETVVVPGQSSPMVEAPGSQGAPPPAVMPESRAPIPAPAGPESVPSRPAPQITPPAPLPPDLEAAPGAGFNLPMGSWGQAFGE